MVLDILVYTWEDFAVLGYFGVWDSFILWWLRRTKVVSRVRVVGSGYLWLWFSDSLNDQRCFFWIGSHRGRNPLIVEIEPLYGSYYL